MFALTDLGKTNNLVDALFGLEVEDEFKCEETGESKLSTSMAKKLVCNIQGGAGSNLQVRNRMLSFSPLFLVVQGLPRVLDSSHMLEVVLSVRRGPRVKRLLP